MMYQKIAIWRAFLTKTKFFSHPTHAYPPFYIHNGPPLLSPSAATDPHFFAPTTVPPAPCTCSTRIYPSCHRTRPRSFPVAAPTPVSRRPSLIPQRKRPPQPPGHSERCVAASVGGRGKAVLHVLGVLCRHHFSTCADPHGRVG
jgi:hypothetical protein